MEGTKNVWAITESGLIEIFAIIFTALIIALRKLPNKIRERSRRKVIKHDHDNLVKAYQELQDLTYIIGAIRAHIIFYENHGPQKFSVMLEAKGHPCGNCISKCRLYNPVDGIKRVSANFVLRKVHEFWLTKVVNVTLAMNGKVNTVTYEDAEKQKDLEQMDIWDEVGTNFVKECFVRTKGTHEFITVCFEFCGRFKNVDHIDTKISDLAVRIKKYL